MSNGIATDEHDNNNNNNGDDDLRAVCLVRAIVNDL